MRTAEDDLDLLNLQLPSIEAPDAAVLDKNLRALAVHSPAAAELIRRAIPKPGVEFIDTDQGEPGLVCEGRTLASRRRPIDEAERLAESVDPGATGVACVLGFGAGYHVRAVGERLGQASVVICFEPDTELLRAVFERVDHSAWLGRTRVVLCCDANDRAPIADALTGLEGLIALGVSIVEHPASKARLDEGARLFAARFTEVVQATKTQVATTLLHSPKTLGNLIANAPAYARAEGVGPLAGVGAGRAAVVVSAGPSLARNIALLENDAYRERVYVIAVQTTLKTLLERGIKPDAVVALDHHEISTRFYEGLSAADVAGVTLVVEPKVNPAVLEAWPGAVRTVASDMLDSLLGAVAGTPKGELRPGATVAHLAYYLARHMGCDPVILTGQDLAFTDHRYYADGAAIHNVWAGELNEFRTLETMEWERIARGKNHLRRVTGQDGRVLFSDEQMASYLAQFEQDFARDKAVGLTTIDASEGGALKPHTEPMPLAEALGRVSVGVRAPMPVPEGRDVSAEELGDRLASVARDADKIARTSRETIRLLDRMVRVQGDPHRFNELVEHAHKNGVSVTGLHPAFGLVQFINQTGVLNRVKADRSIEIKGDATEREAQTMRIERDKQNVESIERAAEELARMLRSGDTPNAKRVRTRANARLSVIVPVDHKLCGLGTVRDLSRPIAGGKNALELTIDRLRASKSVRRIIIATPDPDAARALLDGDRPGVSFERIETNTLRAHLAGVGRSRVYAPACWRGSPGGLSVFDEVLSPAIAAGIMERAGLPAALFVGPEWCLLDPGLIDACVERWAEGEGAHRLVFTNTAPGFAPVLVDRELVTQLASLGPAAGHLGTLAAVLSYVPGAPQTDPIGRDGCVPPDPTLRDCGVRAIADTSCAVARIVRVLETTGSDADARTIAAALAADMRSNPDPVPQRLTLELNTGRLSRGVFASWKRTGVVSGERCALSLPDAHRVLRELALGREDAVVTLDGAGDPLMHPGVVDMVRMCGELRIAGVHVRTELANETPPLAELLDAGVTALSVDLHANDAETYGAMMASDRLRPAAECAQDAARSARVEGGLPSAWVVARSTRCDATLDALPDFYDGWTSIAGTAVIDPAPGGVDRLGPMPVPASALARLARETMFVRSDLVVPGVSADLARTPLSEVWKQACRLGTRGRGSRETEAA